MRIANKADSSSVICHSSVNSRKISNPFGIELAADTGISIYYVFGIIKNPICGTNPAPPPLKGSLPLLLKRSHTPFACKEVTPPSPKKKPHLKRSRPLFLNGSHAS